jgi:hypothetical protein
MTRFPFAFAPNSPDELHCVQCTFRMAAQALTGELLTMDEVERLTGFEEGRESWPFASMLAFAEMGLTVTNTEAFDPDLFVRDPREALWQQLGDEEVVARQFEVSDVYAQVEILKNCLAHPRIEFRNRAPKPSDLQAQLEGDAVLMVMLNIRALHGREGYAGHNVLVHDGTDSTLTFEDPGPPPMAGQRVPLEDFVRAWQSPTEGMANIVRVAPESLATT